MTTATHAPTGRRKTGMAEPGRNARAKATPVKEENKEEDKVEQTAAEMLQGSSEVRIRINWFGTTAKVDDEIAAEMLKDQNADRKAVSISKRLLASKHEALLAVKEARKSIEEHVRAWTIPMIALKVADKHKAVGDDALTRKDAGIRIIQKKDMEGFDDRLNYLAGVLDTAAGGLQAKMPEIMNEDKERLGNLWKQSDYPKDVTKLIGVEVTYKSVSLDVDWMTLCPKIYEREQANAKKKFEAVVENAAVEFASRFVKYVQQVVDQLGNRLRLNPVNDKDKIFVCGADDKEVQVSVREAEVLTVLGHEHEPDEIPEGSVLLQLRLDKAGAKGRSTEVWLTEPITKKRYFDEFRPYETTEKRKLYASTVDNLKAEMDAFLNVGQMLGPYRAVIEGSVTEVKAMLTKGASDLDTERIARELRDGKYFRNEMKEVLGRVVNQVAGAVGEVRERRRSIKKGLIGKV